MKKRGILFARNWCFHDFNFKILHSSRFHLVVFVFFAIFGLGKVLWFCVTKVSGKNQSYSNSYWFCKNLQIGTKCGEKNQVGKIPKRPKISRNHKIFQSWKKFNSKCKKVFYCIFKSVILQILDCTD